MGASSIKSYQELGLGDALIKGLYHEGKIEPTDIEEKILSHTMINPSSNTVVLGKLGWDTAQASMLNLLSRLDKDKPATPQAIYLEPTREVARNHSSIMQQIGFYLRNLSVEMRMIGKPKMKVESQVLVSTPGHALDLISSGYVDISEMKVLVIDRADEAVARQFSEVCIGVKRLLPESIQVMLLADMSDVDGFDEFVQSIAANATRVYG